MTAPTAHEPQADSYEPDPMRWRALSVCLVAGFIVLLDISIVNVALPSIQKGLGAGENTLQWVVSGYALTFGLLLIPAGRLGDARGQRPVFMVGIGLFVLASVVCGLAPTGLILVLARLVQGFAGGLVTPQITALIQTLFKGQERNRAFGLFGTVVGISTGIGPLLGGGIIALFGPDSGWRYVFFVNLPLGVVALLLALRWIPHTKRAKDAERQSLDPFGVVLLGLAVLCILLPFIEQQNWGAWRLGLFPLAAVLLGGWVLHERRFKAEPEVDLGLFRLRSFSLGSSLGLLFFAGFTAVFFIYTQYLQDGLGYPAWKAGLATTPWAFGTALMSSVGAKAVMRRGRPLIALGLLMTLLGIVGTYVAVTLEPGPSAGWWVAAPFLLGGLGAGLVISPNQALTLSQVAGAGSGSAGGVLQTAQRVGGAAGIAFTGSVFYSTVASSKGDFALAFRHGLFVIGAFVAASLVIAIIDSVLTSRQDAYQPEHAQPAHHSAAEQDADAAGGAGKDRGPRDRERDEQQDGEHAEVGAKR